MISLELTLPLEDVEAEVEIYMKNGEKLSDLVDDSVGRIVIKPKFFTTNQIVNLLYGRLQREDTQDVLQQFIMTLSGGTGKCRLQQRMETVEPSFVTGEVVEEDDEVESTVPKGPRP